jgi:hypothetical protein
MAQLRQRLRMRPDPNGHGSLRPWRESRMAHTCMMSAGARPSRSSTEPALGPAAPGGNAGHSPPDPVGGIQAGGQGEPSAASRHPGDLGARHGQPRPSSPQPDHALRGPTP